MMIESVKLHDDDDDDDDDGVLLFKENVEYFCSSFLLCNFFHTRPADIFS